MISFMNIVEACKRFTALWVRSACHHFLVYFNDKFQFNQIAIDKFGKLIIGTISENFVIWLAFFLAIALVILRSWRILWYFTDNFAATLKTGVKGALNCDAVKSGTYLPMFFVEVAFSAEVNGAVPIGSRIEYKLDISSRRNERDFGVSFTATILKTNLPLFLRSVSVPSVPNLKWNLSWENNSKSVYHWRGSGFDMSGFGNFQEVKHIVMIIVR